MNTVHILCLFYVFFIEYIHNKMFNIKKIILYNLNLHVLIVLCLQKIKKNKNNYHHK